MDIISKIVDFFIYADKLPLAVNIILIIAVRILLCIAVYKDALRKKLSESRAYAGLTMAFGIVGYIVFMLITSKLKDKEKKGRGAALTVISVILLCANIALLGYTYESSELNYKIEYYGFDSDVGIFEAENGDKIRYNNLGQGFSLKNMDAFFYQAEDGERYKYDMIKESLDKEIPNEYYFAIPDFCINSKGEICQYNVDENYKSIYLDDELKVIIDSHGELYYYLENCYFDKNGDFVFTDEKLYNLTYDIAVKYFQNDSIAVEYRQCDQGYGDGYFACEYIYKNDNGLYVYYDKLGNEYSICDRSDFKYRDRFGKVYTQTVIPDGHSIVDEDGKYCKNECIDKDGYICFLTDLSCYDVLSSGHYVYTDSNKNLYYSPEDCYWDKDGNLKLSKAVADLTYEQIVSSEDTALVTDW